MVSIGAIEAMARLGFAARGLMYIAVGYLALKLGRTTDNTGALKFIESAGGSVLLGVMALGFVGYGVWRLSDAVLDSEGRGNDAKGIAKRIGGAVSGAVHLAFAWVSARLAFGTSSAGTGGGGAGGAEQGASTALSLPFGGVLLMIGAALLFGVGAYQIVKAYKLGFLKHLDPKAARYEWVHWLGRIGFAARGIVFVMSAVFLWRAAEASNADAAGGTEQALDAFPPWLRLMVAGGFFLFGVFSLVEARYRQINEPDVVDRLRAMAG
ncbi:MAG: DUF1206 domain-containing protein [Sphingomonas bacterium]|nr:DUF1206 domain-containing protein [Sphingomonas bacterium]